MSDINEAYIERLSNNEIKKLVDDYFNLDFFPQNHPYKKIASGLFNKEIEATDATDYTSLMLYLCKEISKRYDWLIRFYKEIDDERHGY